MAPRAQWKGYLKLSLVSCPILLYPAASASERISFRQINRNTGNRLKQQLVDCDTGEVVARHEKGRGYEIGPGAFLLVEDGELEAIQVESTRTIAIDSFVPRAQIDQRYLDSPYYIVPDGQVGADAFAVIREAMRGKAVVALGRVVLSRREHVVTLEPFESGILATTLRYPYEIRNAAEYFEDIPDVPVPADMLQLAEHILDSRTAGFDPTKFEDQYHAAVIELLKRKQAGLPMASEPLALPPARVINLMDALRKSIAAEERKEPQTFRRPAAAAAKAARTGTARHRKAG
jgi:DNA end-binding protein Ku